MNPTIAVMNGQGRPRLILSLAAAMVTTREATTYTATTLTEANGGSKTIEETTIVTDKALVIKITGHGYSQDDWIRISGNTSSTPAINGDHRITAIIDADHFSIDMVCTASSDDGSAMRIPAFDQKEVQVNMRVSTLITNTDYDEVTYGKVTDVTASTITVDEWVNGTPSNGKAATLDGWIADLPYCRKLTETFTPDLIVHKLYRGTRKVRNYGFQYFARLDYSHLLTGDTLELLKNHFAVQDDAQLILIPRVDAPERQYNVYLADPITSAIFYGGRAAVGHKDMILGFQGMEAVGELPITTSGWGYAWGKKWGQSAS